MVDLNKIEHIYIYPGLTDMRLGIFGLRKKILETSELETNALYMFCSMSKNQIKIIEITNSLSATANLATCSGEFSQS